MNVLRHVALSVTLTLALMSAASATVYRGMPHLHLTMAVVNAGGGSAHFSAEGLVRRLAGARNAAENRKLIAQYGASRVDGFYSVFTYAVNDAVKKAHNMLIPLPRTAHPDPRDGRAVAIALYDSGIAPGGRFDVGYMLEVLMSHQIHHNIMVDMDKKFTPAVNANFHVILTALMNDLHGQYAIDGKVPAPQHVVDAH